MTQEEFNNLQIGDVIQNRGSGQAYQVSKIIKDRHGTSFIVYRSLQAYNAIEWEKTPYTFIMEPSNAPLERPTD